MPKEAKVFISEDRPEWLMLIQREITAYGHQVIETASTIEEAMKRVKIFKSLGIQVAILDGNLRPNDRSGNDGQLILAAIKKYSPWVKTIGLSGAAFTGVDRDLGKENIRSLGRTITLL